MTKQNGLTIQELIDHTELCLPFDAFRGQLSWRVMIHSGRDSEQPSTTATSAALCANPAAHGWTSRILSTGRLQVSPGSL